MGALNSKFKIQSSKLMGFYYVKNILFLLVLVTCYLLLVTPAWAQLEIAETFDVPEESVDGDIMSYTDQGVVLSSREYDDKIFGVIETTPLVAYRRQDNTGLPVVRNGTTSVNVTTANGAIKAGDFITTSSLPGKGQKSLASGYIIGVALEEFTEEDGEAVEVTVSEGGTKQARLGTINVAIKIEYAELNTARNANRYLDALNALFFSNIQNPEQFTNTLRYFLAGLAVVVSFLIGFFTLARTLPKGIEALGRNPLAKTTIQFGIILNIIFTVGIALVGIVAAIILLRF
jgi:F0F1-type ATP synthase membrane subunit c/vacuolar-type H+-ATPase subunit K